MTYQSRISPETAQHMIADHDASNPIGPRPATRGRVESAMDIMKRASEEHQARSLTEQNSEYDVYEAIYAMKGRRYIQEHLDEATKAILLEIPLAYQLDLVVERFRQSGEDYPSRDVIVRIISCLTDEGVFTGVDSLR